MNNSWVVPSNPATYDAELAFADNDSVDWIMKNKFIIGDIVYIYEVVPPRGRGGIICSTVVTEINILPEEKIDDRSYWAGGDYSSSINYVKFCRLKLASRPRNGVISLVVLRKYGFTPPQGYAHSLDKNIALLRYIQDSFNEPIIKGKE